MAEAGKVRLVRCPKCENVLPELENYSVYQCGGCGAVLRANNQNLESDVPLEKSDEARNATVLEDSGTATVSGVAEAEGKSCGGISTSDRTVPLKNGTVCRENGASKFEGGLEKQDIDRVHDADVKANGKRGENGDHSRPAGSLSSPCKSQMVFDHQPMRANTAWLEDHHLQNNIYNSRFSTSQYAHEGPSCSKPRSFSYSQEMPSQRPNGVTVDREKRVQYLEDDTAELLRKLDDLRDQLSRSCDVAANSREKAPTVRRNFSSDSYESPSNWVRNEYASSTRDSTQFPGHETHVSPYLSQYPELFPCKPNPFPAYRGSSSSQIHGTAQGKHYMPQYHPYDRRPHPHADIEAFEPFPHREILHHPACSCSHCYRKHHEIFPPIQSAASCKNQFPDVTKNRFLHHQENYGAVSSQYHNMRSAVSVRAFPHEPERPIRLPSSLNSGTGGNFAHFPRGGMALGGATRHRPIAGAAPMITCCHCFELLQLPNEVLRLPKVQQKIQCGACSAVINYEIVGKKLVLPFHEEAQTALGLEGVIHSRSRTIRGTGNFSSDDFDNSVYEFHAMDRMPAKPSANNNLSLSNSQEAESLPSSSPSVKNDENNPIDANSLPGPCGPTHSPLPPGSPLQEHFDYSNQGGNRYGKGNRSSRSEHEKALPSKTAMRQNSLNEASLVTELDVSYNDYNNGGSQDSGDGSKEDDQSRVTKGVGESFLTNFIKKSFKDFARSNQAPGHGKTSVSVNGHPVPARVIKKAEKFAGPIHPGNYWYDSRAGFWGVIGGPCLGIILPSIEEFNFPMLENCAAGSTGVFVNGRELHKQDLDLLSTRGLPADRNRSYIIEMSGRVWDEDTGEELDCLGKLAPTVEKVRHGFGMKAPRAAA